MRATLWSIWPNVVGILFTTIIAACRDKYNEETQVSIIAERLRELRTRDGLTLEELGNRSGCSKGHIWEIENGRTEPKAVTLKRIAVALGVSVDFMLGDEDLDKDRRAVLRFLHLPQCSKDTICNVINAFWESYN